MPPSPAAGHGLNIIELILNAHWMSKLVFACLVSCSVLSIGVIIERSIVLGKARRSTTAALAQLDEWRSAGEWGAARAAIQEATREKQPLFSVLRAGIVYWQELAAVGETRLEVLESLGMEQVTRELRLVRSMLRANLPILANITSVAPFIGLFGTVVGIILTFDAISRSGNMGQDLVASGIADALVATAMGLFAAIPAVLAYNYFTDKVAQLVLSMEEIAMERIYFLMQREITHAPAPISHGRGAAAANQAVAK